MPEKDLILRSQKSAVFFLCFNFLKSRNNLTKSRNKKLKQRFVRANKTQSSLIFYFAIFFLAQRAVNQSLSKTFSISSSIER